MRRRLVLGVSGAAIAAALGLQVFRPTARIVTAEPDSILDLIGREFGAVFTASEEARAFAEKFTAAQLQPEVFEEEAIFAFIKATNVIRALETGDELVYVGLAELRVEPCRNTLSSWWL